MYRYYKKKQAESLKVAKWRKDEWRMMKDECWRMNVDGWMMMDEWRAMKNEWGLNEGWMINEEGCCFQAVEGFCWRTDRLTDGHLRLKIVHIRNWALWWLKVSSHIRKYEISLGIIPTSGYVTKIKKATRPIALLLEFTQLTRLDLSIKTIFRCDSNSRNDPWEVLLIIVLNLINFEDSLVFQVEDWEDLSVVTDDQQITNKWPTEDLQKENKRPTKDPLEGYVWIFETWLLAKLSLLQNQTASYWVLH